MAGVKIFNYTEVVLSKFINSTDSASSYFQDNDSYEVETVTLNDILDRYNFKQNILKIDWECCEFNIILNQDFI